MVDTKATQLIGVLGLFLGLTWLFTLLRVYVRCVVSRSWGADDFLLIASLVSFTTYVGLALGGIPCGIGRHTSDIPAQDMPQGLIFWWLVEIFYIITTLLLRCSIAVFILRICTKRVHKILTYVTTATVLVYSAFFLLLVIFQCLPASYYWTRYSPTQHNRPGTCLTPEVLLSASFVHSGVSAIVDWVLGILPIWLIWDLQMNISTKVSIGVILSFGMIAGIAALIRIPFIRILAHPDDFLFYATDVAIWSGVEPGLGIIATAACVLRPLLKKFYDSSIRSTSRTHGPHTRHSTGRNGPPSHTQTRIFSKSNLGHESRMDGIEMGSRATEVTSGLRNQKCERGTDSNKKSQNFLQRTRGNESEEELTGGWKGIHVKTTVHGSSHESVAGQRREGSFSSLDSAAAHM